MLIRFVVSNFLSFDQEKEFNMIAGNFKTHKHHVYQLPKLNVLKAAAIYGANGAGKSNLIRAVEYLKELIDQGEILKSIDPKKFKLNKTNSSLPVNFEIEFFSEKKTYAYGVSISHTSILEEWLYETGITRADKMIFERKLSKNHKSTIKIAEKYLRSAKDKLLVELMEDNLLKSNELLISKHESLKVKEFEILIDWMADNLVVIFPQSKFTGLVPALTSSSRFKAFANELLQTFDTGVKNLDIETIDFDAFIGKDDQELRGRILEGVEQGEEILFHSRAGSVMVVKDEDNVVVKKLVSTHNDNNGKLVQFDLTEESDGTQRILDFIPAINNILHQDMTILIDEIDQSLHPVLLKALVEKVMGDENTNGQLIFTTHESNLLDMDTFRQDEIWFVEKDQKLGSSHMYSLSEFKPRYDLDIKKGYLKGRFGAIPFLANLETLNWQECDA